MEVAQPEARLAELRAKKVTRAPAEKHPELRSLHRAEAVAYEVIGDPAGAPESGTPA